MRLLDLIREEPVAFQYVLQTIIGVFVVFGLEWTTEQILAVLTCTAGILTWWTRKQVTPVSKP